MVPLVEDFVKEMKRLKIQRNHRIVCYDVYGFLSAPRTAWLLRYFGAENV